MCVFVRVEGVGMDLFFLSFFRFFFFFFFFCAGVFFFLCFGHRKLIIILIKPKWLCLFILESENSLLDRWLFNFECFH